jgi:predicted nicotinamide N-methyase
VVAISGLAATELRQPDPPLPFWAFAWAGGLAIARYLVDHPEEIEGRRVLDVASGSGLCAIVAMRLGAASVHAVDIDPLSEAAVAVNARANGVRIGFSRRDILGDAPPVYDAILAGDIFYEETMAARFLRWLERAAGNGSRVLIGDPGRTYQPSGLQRLASYEVRTSRELEASEVKRSAVFTLPRNLAVGTRQPVRL